MNTRSRVAWLARIALALLVANAPALRAEEARPTPCTEDAMIVFDASGSMYGDERGFMEVLSKRMVSHYYMTIIQLGDALMKQRVVTGDRACRELIEGCISRAPVNSLNVYCPCHTDPMKVEIEKTIARYRKRGVTVQIAGN